MSSCHFRCVSVFRLPDPWGGREGRVDPVSGTICRAKAGKPAAFTASRQIAKRMMYWACKRRDVEPRTSHARPSTPPEPRGLLTSRLETRPERLPAATAHYAHCIPREETVGPGTRSYPPSPHHYFHYFPLTKGGGGHNYIFTFPGHRARGFWRRSGPRK